MTTTKEVRSVQPAPYINLDWSDEQRAVIAAPKSARLLVEAGPGTGKTAVACARVASLIASGDAVASKILVVSFTRTAVREIRDRIFAFAKESPEVARVKITTIDSHSWGLRNGFEEESDRSVLASLDYHTNMERLCTLLEEKNEGLTQFLSELDHLIIDEAQDIVGIRSRMLGALSRALDESCGITAFLDPAQAIYGFTTDRDEGPPGLEESFGRRVSSDLALRFESAKLTKLFRSGNKTLSEVFEKTRPLILPDPAEAQAAFRGIRERVLALAKSETADRNALDLDGRHDALVLFRRRCEVLACSSWMSSRGIEHRLRISGLPTVVRPWIGRLLSRHVDPFLTRTVFDVLWQTQVGDLFLGQPTREQGWSQLRRLAGDATGRVEMNRLRRVLARSRPPIEVCSSELGFSGPIVGTIHASKGREADHVRLVVPHFSEKEERSDDEWREEARVLYVGATRAKSRIEVIEGSPSYIGYADSGRAYKTVSKKGSISAQVQFGMLGDVDHRQQFSGADPERTQEILARLSGQTHRAKAIADPAKQFAYRLELEPTTDVPPHQCIGFFDQMVNKDLFAIGKKAAKGKSVRPSFAINYLYVAAVTTVAVDEDIELPFPFAASKFFLAPVVRGYPTVFFSMYGGRR